MLFNTNIQFSEYPQPVKVGIVSLVAGWALHFVYYYMTTVAGSELVRTDYLMIGIGVAICFFVAAINKWARMMCIFFNIAIILMYLAFTLLQPASFGLKVLSGTVAGLFCLSTYYLLKKETAAYFQHYNQPPEQDQPEQSKED